MWPFTGTKDKANHVDWEGPWSVGKGVCDGLSMIVRINDGVRPLVGQGQFSQHVSIATPLLAPNKFGFPETEEMDSLAELEDRLCEVLQADHRCVHVLTLTIDGMREFVFYTDEPSFVRSAFAELAESAGPHELQLSYQPDPEWTVYQQFCM